MHRCICVHSFIQTISIVPLQVNYYSEALPTQHGYCAGVSHRSTTGNYELRTCPRSYMVARVRVEPMTLWAKGVISINAPHTSHMLILPSIKRGFVFYFITYVNLKEIARSAGHFKSAAGHRLDSLQCLAITFTFPRYLWNNTI